MHCVERNGVRAPAIGLGTYPMVGEECYLAVLWALQAGYRHIDTAQLYGNEADVGRVLADSSVLRGDIFLTAKCTVRLGGNFPEVSGAAFDAVQDFLLRRDLRLVKV